MGGGGKTSKENRGKRRTRKKVNAGEEKKSEEISNCIGNLATGNGKANRKTVERKSKASEKKHQRKRKKE